MDEYAGETLRIMTLERVTLSLIGEYRMTEKGTSLLRIVGLICLIAVLGCSVTEQASKKPIYTTLVAVKTVQVEETSVQRTSTQPATVHPYFRTEIRARVSGYVKDIKVDIGDLVGSGDTLVEIDVPEMQKQREIIQAKIKRFEALKQRANSGIKLAEANVQSSDAKLSQAKSEMNRANAILAAAEAEFQRTSDLVQRKSLEGRMLDEVRKKRDSELANKVAVESAILAVKADVSVAKAELLSAEASATVAAAETEIARRQLDELDVLIGYATLKSPFAGIVTDRSVNLGDLVRETNDVGSGHPLFEISQVDKVRIQTLIPERDAAFVNRGDLVKFTFPSFNQEETTGTVTRISASLDPSTRTMLVEIEMPNPDGKLLPGMFGQATINLTNKTNANLLPARAVRFDADGQPFVYVVGQDQIVSVVQVTTGIDTGKTIEILSGVQSGQRVVDAHLKRFKTGQKVTLLTN